MNGDSATNAAVISPQDLYGMVGRCLDFFERQGIRNPAQAVKRLCKIPKHTSLTEFVDLYARSQGYRQIIGFDT